ncbi:cytochrome P450 [Annulohypoxylon bovei var. microspora]|nr:cytochrome P450 [Annulohypoxylon bovei var. microspora]
MASTFAIYIVTALILLIPSYYLLIHPLSRYPGPFVAKFTNGYGAFYALRRSLHLVTWEQHRKYGPVIRQGPNKLVFNSATALKDIYQNERLTKPVNYLSNQASPGSHNTWNSLDINMHRQRRKLTGPAVNERSMRAFEPTMMNEVDTFIKQIALSQECPIDMKKRCDYLGMDVVCLLSFGFAIHSQTDEKYRFLPEEISAGNRRLHACMQVPIIAKHRLQVPINTIFYKSREKVFRLLEVMIKTRMTQDQRAKHDLYSFVADALKTEEGKSLRVNDIWMEAILFLVAGGDTTSTTVAATLFYLARHRKCYEKLANEIRSTFKDGSEICGSKLASCQYLRACVDEALRMSPPIPGVLWRELASDEDTRKPLVVDGHVIPKGTYVGVSTYTLHHNEDYFPDPFTYKPERWVDPNGEDGAPGSRKVMYDAFAPFSVGYRGCAGKAMAYLEINLVIAKALWYFDFKPAPGKLGDVGLSDKGEFHIHDVFISTHDGPWLVFTPRTTLAEDFPDLKGRSTE